MADNSVVFKVAADFDNAIKEWEQLRDKVATTTKEYEDAQKAIEDLKIAKGEFTGVAYKSKKAIEEERQALKRANDEYKKREKELNNVFKAQEKNVSSVQRLTKKQKQQSDATGATTSATLELGRVVSDAPYGIRGMANNVSQLASNLFFMSKKVDQVTGKTIGFKGALKGLVGGLLGPAGVLVAFQALVAILEWQNSLKKTAIDIEKKLNEEISKTLSVLREVEWLSQNRINRSKEIIKLEEDINDAKKRGNDKEVNRLLREKIGLEIEQAKVHKETLRGVVEDTKGTDRNVEAQKALFKANEKLYKLERQRDRLDIKKVGKSGGRKLSPFKTKDELELEAKSQLNAINNYSKKIELQENKNNEKSELILADSEEKKKAIKEKYAKLNLEVQLNYEEKGLDSNEYKEKESAKKKYENYVKDLDNRLEAYKKSVKDRSNAEELINKAKSETDEKRGSARKELKSTIASIEGEYESLKEYFFELADARRDALGFVGDDKKEEELKGLSDYLQIYKDLMGGVGDFISAEYDRQSTIEENKTNKLNEELNNRLLNENLSKDERQRIQNEIAQNDEKLRKKQERIAKKKFETDKAFNISSAIMDTYAGATKAFAQDGKFGFISGAAIIAQGLINVATIARQKFQSSSANTPINTGGGAGGAGGVGDREFNFNLVGNTQENQLLETLQGQFDRPLQAFVVSKDITTQQELDANIQGQARI